MTETTSSNYSSNLQHMVIQIS